MAVRRAWWGRLFIAPFVLGFFVFFFQPVVLSFYYSSTNITVTAKGFQYPWTGLENYRELFTRDVDFLPTLWTTLQDMFQSLLVILLFSMFMAIILNQKFRGRTFVRAVFFLPVIISSGIIISILHDDVFNQTIQSGAASSTYIFQSTGIGDMMMAMNLPESVINFVQGVISGIFDMLWKTGVQILIFLAAMQGVPIQLYEAARVEGATSWEAFWKITFPIVSPMILVNVIYTIVDSFTNYMNPMMQLIDKVGIVGTRYSYACAIAWVFLLVVLVFILLAWLTVSRFVVYQDGKVS